MRKRLLTHPFMKFISQRSIPRSISIQVLKSLQDSPPSIDGIEIFVCWRNGWETVQARVLYQNIAFRRIDEND